MTERDQPQAAPDQPTTAASAPASPPTADGHQRTSLEPPTTADLREEKPVPLREQGEQPSSSLPLVPGYEVLEVLGRGGMGVVYRARHAALKRVVALKMILAGGHAGEQELKRFHAEGEAIARLQHLNIVQIYEVGEHNGLPFFSLEF